MTYQIEAFKTDHISWKSGVSPRAVTKWVLIDSETGRKLETFDRKRDAERALRLMPKSR